MREADKDLQEYHKLVELFRQELQGMRNKIENTNDEVTDTTRPLIEALYRSLELGMVNQKEENSNFQEQLTELKKEKSILNQMIVATSKRTEMLNEDVGHYWWSIALIYKNIVLFYFYQHPNLLVWSLTILLHSWIIYQILWW